MRRLLFVMWLLLPVAALGYHFGPGQELMRADDAGVAVARARALLAEARAVAAKDGDEAARKHWALAEEACGKALELLPNDRVDEARAILLERAKAQMFVSQLPEARRVLGALVEELADDPNADPALLADARATLANSQYYTTWLMRLEGAPREEWEPEIESARQTYKLLAERAERDGAAEDGARAQDGLEAAIQLARLDLADLQGLPLPSQ